jgi:hypothetical protein
MHRMDGRFLRRVARLRFAAIRAPSQSHPFISRYSCSKYQGSYNQIPVSISFRESRNRHLQHDKIAALFQGLQDTALHLQGRSTDP